MRCGRVATALVVAFLSGCTAVGGPADGERAASRRARQPRGMAYVSGSLGWATHETQPLFEPGLDDRSDARQFRAMVEGGDDSFGGGVQFESTWSDDDLHDNEVPGTHGRVRTYEVFPYLMTRPETGPRFRIPVRFGPDLQIQDLDLNDASVGPIDQTFVNLGFQCEVEPEFDLHRRDKSAVSLYAAMRGGSGYAVVDLETNADSQDFWTYGYSFGAEAGLRVQLHKFLLTGGWIYRWTWYDASDTEWFDGQPTFIYATDFAYQGFFVGAGARW